MKDYNNNELKPNDRVKSIYVGLGYETENFGTITADGKHLIYDDEPQTEYKILDSRYLIKCQTVKTVG